MFMHGSSMSAHIAIFLGLIALGVGYWVCIQARSDTHCPKWGKFLGLFITFVAALGLACTAYMTVRKVMQKDPWHEKMMMGHPPIMMPMDGAPGGAPAEEGNK